MTYILMAIVILGTWMLDIYVWLNTGDLYSGYLILVTSVMLVAVVLAVFMLGTEIE